MLPAGDGLLVNGLADLRDAGGAHRPAVLVKGQTPRLPLPPAPGDEPPRMSLIELPPQLP